MDGFPVLSIPIHPPTHYCTHEYEQIIAVSTGFYDPLAEHEWVIDYTVTNLDSEPITGVIQTSFYLIKVGTPEMTEKTVKCKHCRHEFKVPLKQTIIDCPYCHKTFVLPFYGAEAVV